MSALADLLEKALNLSVEDRAALAERLLDSLEELSSDEAERVWAEEAERRLDDLRSGKARSIPAEEVHKKAKELPR